MLKIFATLVLTFGLALSSGIAGAEVNDVQEIQTDDLQELQEYQQYMDPACKHGVSIVQILMKIRELFDPFDAATTASQ